MTIRKPLLAVALAATLVGGAHAQSHSHPDAAPPRDGQALPLRSMGPERMFEGLDLTDAQRTQLRGMADEHRAVIEPLRDKMRAAQQTLETSQPGDPDHDAKTADARKTLQETRGQMREEMEKFRARTDAVLTPEQRKQVEQRRSKMRERMGERRGGRRGDGAGGRPPRGG
jgi:Spy/CpxP family protein refolding chaperone